MTFLPRRLSCAFHLHVCFVAPPLSGVAPPPAAVDPPISVVAPPPAAVAPPRLVVAPPPAAVAPPISVVAPPPAAVAPPPGAAAVSLSASAPLLMSQQEISYLIYFVFVIPYLNVYIIYLFFHLLNTFYLL